MPVTPLTKIQVVITRKKLVNFVQQDVENIFDQLYLVTWRMHTIGWKNRIGLKQLKVVNGSGNQNGIKNFRHLVIDWSA